MSADKPLTTQQELFAQHVAAGNSQAAAYRMAYPKSQKWKEDAVHCAGAKMMSMGRVSERVSELLKKAADSAGLKAEEIIEEVKRLALSDVSGIFHEDGSMRLPHEMDARTRASIAGIKQTQFGIEYKFWDKNAALDKASKILGLYEKDNKQKTDPLAQLLKDFSGNVLGVVGNPPAGQDEDL